MLKDNIHLKAGHVMSLIRHLWCVAQEILNDPNKQWPVEILFTWRTVHGLLTHCTTLAATATAIPTATATATAVTTATANATATATATLFVLAILAADWCQA